MQADLGSLASREHWPTTMRLYRQLRSNELEILVDVGLHFVGRWPRIRAHTAMMTTLVERWDSRYNTFHLPTARRR